MKTSIPIRLPYELEVSGGIQALWHRTDPEQAVQAAQKALEEAVEDLE